MTTDALGNPIRIGERYGYASTSNGIIHVVTGIAESVTEKRVTLRNVYERDGVYGKLDEPNLQSRKRSVYSTLVFHIPS